MAVHFEKLLHWILKKEFFRYFLVSVLALMLDVGVFSVSLRLFHLPWVWAAVLGFVAGAILAWMLSIRMVFRHRTLRRSPMVELVWFILIGVMGLGVTEVVLWLSIERLHIVAEFGRLLAAWMTFIFNFVVRKIVLFRKSKNHLQSA